MDRVATVKRVTQRSLVSAASKRCRTTRTVALLTFSDYYQGFPDPNTCTSATLLCFDAQRRFTQRTVSFPVVNHTVGERYRYAWCERAKQPHLNLGLPRKSKQLGCTTVATGQLIGLSFPVLGLSAQGSAGNACGWLPFAMTAAKGNNRYDAANLDLHSLQTANPTRMVITADPFWSEL